MLKRQLPHIILRFSKHPPPAPPPPSTTTPEYSDGYTTALEHSCSSRSDYESDSASDASGASSAGGDPDETDSDPDLMARARPMRANAKARLHSIPNAFDGPAAAEKRNMIKLTSASRPALPALPAPALGKRKRPIPKAIGGGKGNLQPPAPAQMLSLPQGTHVVAVNGEHAAPAVPELHNAVEKKDDKRVLRSQDVQKRSDYEEWFESSKEEEYDLQMPLVDELPPDPSPPVLWPWGNLATVNSLVEPLPNMLNAKPTKSSKSKKHKPETLDPQTSRATPDPDDPGYIDYLRSIPVIEVDLEEEARKEQLAMGISSTRPSTRLSDPQPTPLSPDEDPLPDSLYLELHVSAARREKRYSNIEVDQHTYSIRKIEDDIDSLRSPDWMRGIGLSSGLIKSTDVRVLEKRRDRLIEHLEALVVKHNTYKSYERALKKDGGKGKAGSKSKSPFPEDGDLVQPASARRYTSHNNRRRRPSAGSAQEDEFDVPVSSSSSSSGSGSQRHRRGRSTAGAESDLEPHLKRTQRRQPPSRRNPTITNLTDAAPTTGASRCGTSKKRPHDQTNDADAVAEKPFKSFYPTPYARQQAMSTSRKSARNQTAFGVSLPALVAEERDFELPKEVRDEAAARDLRARKRHRSK